MSEPLCTAASAAETFDNSSSQGAVALTQHVCVKLPCVFCAITTKTEINKAQLVVFMPASKKQILARLAGLLARYDEDQLLAFELLFANVTPTQDIEKPVLVERRLRSRRPPAQFRLVAKL